MKPYILGILLSDSQDWHLVHWPRTAQIHEPPIATIANGWPTGSVQTTRRTEIREAVVSSCHLSALTKKGPLWPHVCEFVEWYVMMQSDLLHPELAGIMAADSFKPRSAMDFMAHYSYRDEVVDATASIISTAATGHELTVVALATFLPNLAAPPDSDSARIARRALHFVYGVACRIPSVRTIELVAGSRVTGMWPAHDTTQPLRRVGKGSFEVSRTFVANILSEQEAITNIVANLESVVAASEDCSKATEDADRIIWAIELEPGPLFALCNGEMLKALCSSIDQSARLNRRVGLNLDVSHFRISCSQCKGTGTAPDLALIRGNSSIFDRIAHAHIAGHHPGGHFGDLPLRFLNRPADFDEWIALLAYRHSSNGGSLRFSGHVSLELEALRDLAWLPQACNDLRSLL